MKIAYITTYPPKQCGIATYTHDLILAIAANPEIQQEVIAIIEEHDQSLYPAEVVYKIRRNELEDYNKAAEWINQNGYDFVVIEHEYGIFGGNSGMYILSFAKSIHCALVVSFHTILERPSNDESTILIELSSIAQRIIVMSSHAEHLLQKVYQINLDKVLCIPHGVPEYGIAHEEAKASINLTDRKVILTFGFLGRNKGIELVIKSLPAVVEQHPDVLYIIAGKTHPNVIAHSGEEYREYLEELVDAKELRNNVKFINSYMPINELTNLLSACDVYITPYANEAQITSGTLSYAIGAGAAVISTPYWHAKDLLAEDRGILIPFRDKKALSNNLNKLFENSALLNFYRKNAKAYGEKITWPKIGIAYFNLFKQLKNENPDSMADSGIKLIKNLPEFSLQHINRLTNNVGIIQHAKYATPNYFEGYCLDDNSRAVLLELMAYQTFDLDIKDLHFSTYLAYIFYAQNEDGKFKNFMNFQNQFIDKLGSEDAFGRTIWSLGYFFQMSPVISHYELAREMFFKAKPHFESLISNRAIAYTIMGISYYLKNNQNDEQMTEILRGLALQLAHEFEAHQTEDWQWFENIITYDNAFLPLALIHSSNYLNDPYLYKIGVKTFEFLDQLVYKNEYLSLIGNKGWYKKGMEKPNHVGQQPIDASSMTLLYHEMYIQTREDIYYTKMIHSFEWFLGRNDLKISIYDPNSKGCCDGLEEFGINRNQGAESTISFWIAYLTVYNASTTK